MVVNWIESVVELYRRNTISVVCPSSRAFISHVEKDGLVTMCRISEDAKPVWLLKRSVEFCERRSWLLTNFTWDFAKRLEIRRYFWYLETCSFLPLLKTRMTYGSSLKWIILLPEIYLLLQSRREEICELICHWHNGLSLKRCLNHWTISLHL